MELEHKVRWQYLYDKKQAFDSTPLGWHSFGRREACLLEARYQAKSDEPARIKASSSGYEYSVDVSHMVQRNRSTGKTRSIRRLELPLRRVTVAGGSKFGLDVDFGEGEVVEWFFEVQGGAKIDFRACFVPAGGEASVVGIQRATWHSIAGDFAAPRAGRVHFVWENFYKMASPRVLLFHCKAASSTAGPTSVPQVEADRTLAEFLGEQAIAGVAHEDIAEAAAGPAREEFAELEKTIYTLPKQQEALAGPALPAVDTAVEEQEAAEERSCQQSKQQDLTWQELEAAETDSFSEWEVISFDPTN